MKGITEIARQKSERPQAEPDMWELRLYVAGQTPKSMAAFANLKKLCEEHLEGKYKIELVDLLKNPHSPKEIRYLPFRPLCGNFPRL